MDQMSKRLSLIIALLLLLAFTRASNIISSGQSLFANHTIVSEGVKFELGFFTPGNSQKYYIGIWYKNIPQRTVIWVANRDKPISNIDTSELKIAKNGSLLLTQSQTTLWSSSLTTLTTNHTVAVLLDTGNFVLRDATNSSDVLWQSFDYPTDSWLPNQKIGVNRITGEDQLIVSWRNSEDPSPGIYALGLDRNGASQFFLWRNGTEYWDSGLWYKTRFNNVPGMETGKQLSYHVQDNKQGNYFTYTPSNISSISRILTDITGQAMVIQWMDESQAWLWVCVFPNNPCSVPYICGGFGSCNFQIEPFCNCLQGFTPSLERDWKLSDWSGGCVRRTPLQCGNGNSSEKDGFLMIHNIQLPINSHYLTVESAEDCELACLNDCSCTAYSFSGSSSGSGCSIWYHDLFNIQEQNTGEGAGTLFVRLAASELQSYKGKKGAVIWAIIVGTAGSLALLALVLLLTRCRRRIGVMGKPKTEAGLVTFRYGELQYATKNFSEKLGEGGFGAVFKGVLPDSRVIAVKKLEGLQQGEKQFRSEVSTIGMIQHVNLVQLHGFCSEGNNKLLVYEYMLNGSLGAQLFQNNTSKILNWKQRYDIALGIARGLTYLHEKCRDCIIHCDIKPENVLLDSSFVPKVADFGLAKLLGRDFSRVLTTMRGTVGYLAPEWISGVPITAKADVYSYGMMIFEIISGERNWKQTHEENHTFFPIFAAKKLLEGDVGSLVDHRLEGDVKLEEVVRACKVACWCIQDDENCRPTMGQVILILEGVLEVNVPPIPQRLQILAEVAETLGQLSCLL